jgi:phage repressor protein C with HTH and peptisase S24 domain
MNSATSFDSFFDRVRDTVGIASQTELAGLLRVNRSAVSQAKKRGVVPRTWIYALSRAYGLSPDWLEAGAGSPYMPAHSGEAEGVVMVPKVSAKLCAGGGSHLTDDDVLERLPFREDWLRRRGSARAMVLMDVFGNSMEPEIREGDVVLVNTTATDIYAGGIYAVGVEDTVMVKRIEKRPGTLVLLSDNKEYEPVQLRGEEIDSVRIIGKVAWIGREYR